MNKAEAIDIMARWELWRAFEDWEGLSQLDTLPDMNEHDYSLVVRQMKTLLPGLSKFSERKAARQELKSTDQVHLA